MAVNDALVLRPLSLPYASRHAYPCLTYTMPAAGDILTPCTTVNCFTLGSRPAGVACPCGGAAASEPCLPLLLAHAVCVVREL